MVKEIDIGIFKTPKITIILCLFVLANMNCYKNANSDFFPPQKSSEPIFVKEIMMFSVEHKNRILFLSKEDSVIAKIEAMIKSLKIDTASKNGFQSVYIYHILSSDCTNYRFRVDGNRVKLDDNKEYLADFNFEKELNIIFSTKNKDFSIKPKQEIVNVYNNMNDSNVICKLKPFYDTVRLLKKGRYRSKIETKTGLKGWVINTKMEYIPKGIYADLEVCVTKHCEGIE